MVGVAVRGAAPATRETDLCRPGTLVEVAHAIVLAGGSAFGLAAAGGVMRWLWERGIGFPTGVTPVPIVPAASIFDLGVGEIDWPDEAMGYAACAAANDGAVAEGSVGAGIGGSVGKLRGMKGAMRGGIGSAAITVAGATVAALVVVNAFGDVVARDGHILAGARDAAGGFVDTAATLLRGMDSPLPGRTNTTIGVVATDAILDPATVNRLAAVAHDGLARAIRPVHTHADGDTLFALATGRTRSQPSIVQLETASAEVVARAVVRAVLLAEPGTGLPVAPRSRNAWVE